MQAWLVNGDKAGAVCLDDRGFIYGDGLFETIALRRGQPRHLQLHMARLASGCQRLSIPFPEPRLIESQIDALTSGHDAGTVKIIVTRGVGPRGYAPPARPRPTLHWVLRGHQHWLGGV
jgi:4-amino-4-deoxychorismate lyase